MTDKRSEFEKVTEEVDPETGLNAKQLKHLAANMILYTVTMLAQTSLSFGIPISIILGYLSGELVNYHSLLFIAAGTWFILLFLNLIFRKVIGSPDKMAKQLKEEITK